MKLIIGLGNPGFRYKKTRHNAGFMALDYFQKNIGGFSKWKNKKAFKAEISENPDQEMFLAKPQTYMNRSGEAVALLTSYYKLPLENLFVAHDDFDLCIGNFKLEKEIGSAGHKGIQSIIETLGTNSFWRLRVGIKPIEAGASEKAENFVLKKFFRDEKAILEKTIIEATKALFETIND